MSLLDHEDIRELRSRSPFVGLGPFSEHDSARFFGREKETDAIVDLAAGNRFAVVLGMSGAGKTSLLRCRVVPRLRALGHAVLYLRFNADVCAAIQDAMAAEFPERSDDPDPVRGLIRLSRTIGRPLLLIWDQFEELYTRGTADVRSLSYDVIRRLVVTEASRTSVLLGIREDYAVEVFGLAAHVDCTFTSRSVFRLRSFSAREDVAGILGRTLALGGVQASAASLHLLSGRLCATGACYPPHLQIYGEHLFQEALRRGISSVDETLVHDLAAPEQVVFDRMTQVLDDVVEPVRASIKRVLECLVTPWGTRRRATRADLLETTELPDAPLATTLRVLEDLHFLVGSDAGGYELVHDYVARSLAQQFFSEAERRSLLASETVRHAYDDWRQHGVRLGASRTETALAGYPWPDLRSAVHRAYLFVALLMECRPDSIAKAPELRDVILANQEALESVPSMAPQRRGRLHRREERQLSSGALRVADLTVLQPTATALLALVATARPAAWPDLATALPLALRGSRAPDEPDEPFWEAARGALETLSHHIHASRTVGMTVLHTVLTTILAKGEVAGHSSPNALVRMVLAFIAPIREYILYDLQTADRLAHRPEDRDLGDRRPRRFTSLQSCAELLRAMMMVAGVRGFRALLVSCHGVAERYEELIVASALQVTHRGFWHDLVTELCGGLLEDAEPRRRLSAIRLLHGAWWVDRERVSRLLASATADRDSHVASEALRSLARVNSALAVSRAVELLQNVRPPETSPVVGVAFEVVAACPAHLTPQDIRAIAHHLSDGATGTPILLAHLDPRLPHDELAERISRLGPDLALRFVARWDSEALASLLANHVPLLVEWTAASDANRWSTACGMASSSVAVRLLIVTVLFAHAGPRLLDTMKLGLAARCRLNGERHVVAAYCCATSGSGKAPPGEMLDLLLSVLESSSSPYLEACVLMTCLSSLTEAQRTRLFAILPRRRRKMESEGTWSLAAGAGATVADDTQPDGVPESAGGHG